jgi:hypothetical protein
MQAILQARLKDFTSHSLISEVDMADNPEEEHISVGAEESVSGGGSLDNDVPQNSVARSLYPPLLLNP